MSSSQYTYNPASSQSTRQILDPTSPSRSHPTNPSDYPSSAATGATAPTSSSNTNVPFRPGQPIRSSSSNYANAASLVRAKEREEVEANANVSGGNDYFSTSSAAAAAPANGAAGERKESTSGVAGWKPNFTRKMSWDPQELKREMHVRHFSGAGLGEDGQEQVAGFSEK